MRLVDRPTTRFQTELCAWLDEHASSRGGPLHPNGSDRTALLRKWQHTLFDHGWLVPTWPPELGGRDASSAEHMLYLEELSRRGLPRSLHAEGLDVCVPAVMEHGTDEQIDRWVVPSLRGACGWVLAPSARVRDAEGARPPEIRDAEGGAGWTVSGVAGPVMGVQEADRLLIAVAGPPADPAEDAEHAPPSSTVLAIELAADGVNLRTDPTSGSDMATVILDDVAVTEDDVIGTPGDGRRVVVGIEARARSARWIASLLAAQRGVDRLARFIAEGHVDEDGMAEQLGGLYAQAAAVRALAYRVVAKEAVGHPAPELAILPVAAARVAQDVTRAIVAATGMAALDWSDGFGAGPDGRTVEGWLAACRSGMYTLADREAIVERVLGLPRS